MLRGSNLPAPTDITSSPPLQINSQTCETKGDETLMEVRDRRAVWRLKNAVVGIFLKALAF